jgi:ATP-dependent exoDNAse (exonuclease V) alpha subunit
MNLPENFKWVDTSDEYFSEALNRVLFTSDNINIVGPAGVGKSVLIKIAASMLGSGVAICSTTGISAVNLCTDGVKATTLHSLLHLKPLPYFTDNMIVADPTLYQKIRAIHTLIIDEASMLSSHLFDVIFKLLVLYKGAVSKLPRIILFSDVLQLAPVVNNDHMECSEMYRTVYQNKIMFFNSKFFEDLQFKTIHLNKLHRQKDGDFQSVLNRIRVEQHTKKDLEFLNRFVKPLSAYNRDQKLYMHIATTNKAVDKINEDYYTLFSGNTTTYKSFVKGIFDMSKLTKKDFEVNLKPDMQIMCIKNNALENYQNGSLGKVVQCNLNSVEVELKNGSEVCVGRSETHQYEYRTNEDGELVCESTGFFNQIDLRTSKSITVHKSQGQTLDAIYFDPGNYVFAEGLTYVALSRIKDVNNLGLKRPLRMNDIRANKESLQFLNTI